MSHEEHGELVGTGSFLVDRSQALDKLMRFQLNEPAGFVLLWLRCAAASGASHFSLRCDGNALDVRFDGRPFGAEELRDPYRCLFESRSAENARNRFLAIGLLSALRLEPYSTQLCSGRGAQRRRLMVHSIEKESLEPAPEPEERTRITLSLERWTRHSPADEGVRFMPGPADDAVRLLREGCKLSKLEIAVDGEVLPGWREGPRERHHFDSGEAHGWVSPPGEEDVVVQSRLELYAYGALVETLKLKLPWVQARVALNDDSLTLDASQSGVVRDARFEGALKRLDEPLRRLVDSELARLANEMPETAQSLVDPGLSRRWRDVIERNGSPAGFAAVLDAAAALIMVTRSDAAAAIERRAKTVRWLRAVCAHRLRPRGKEPKAALLRPRDKEPKDALDAALWSAPLWIGADGAPLSLKELQQQHEKLSYLPVSSVQATGVSLPFRALWVVAAGEQELPARLAGGPVRDVGPTIERLKSAARAGGHATFEQAGLPPPLIRVELGDGKVGGELGLSSAPERAGRLHLLTEGMQSGVVEERGPLRFDAVVSDASRVWGANPLTPSEEELCKALLAEARGKLPALYRGLAQDYEPADVSARAAAIRAHLLDYLLDRVLTGGPSGGTRDDAWELELPLFSSSLGPLSYLQLAERQQHGEPVYAARELQEQAWEDGKLVIAGNRLEEAFLRRLFANCAVAQVRGRPGVFVLLRSPDAFCAAAKGARCAFGLRLGADAFHAAVPASGAFSWEQLCLHEAEPGPHDLDLKGHDDLVLELMAVLLRQHGTLHETPTHPFRRLLLALLEQSPPPWPGAAGKALWKTLRGRPFFRSPGGGRSLEDVYAALHAPSGHLSFALVDRPEPAADLVLDARELEVVRRLQPAGADRVRPYGAPRERRAAPAEPPEPKFHSVFRGKRLIKPHLRFMLERRYQDEGLDVWFGLPSKLPTPAPSFVPGGKADFELASLPRLAHVLVDAAAWPAGRNDAMPVLFELLGRFYAEVADAWPLVNPTHESFSIAQRHIMEAVRLSGQSPDAFPGWESVRHRLLALKLFPMSDGSWISLHQLRESAQAEGALRYVHPGIPRAALEGGPAPVLRHPERVAELLGGVRLKRAKDLPPPAPPRPERAAQAPASPVQLPPEPEPDETDAAPIYTPSLAPPYELLEETPPALALAHRLMLRLRGRKGLRLPRRELGRLLLARRLSASPLTIDDNGWVLDAEHPLVAAVLRAPLPPEEQAAYLASVAYTAANRLQERVTDADDICFQEALASALEEGASGTSG